MRPLGPGLVYPGPIHELFLYERLTRFSCLSDFSITNRQNSTMGLLSSFRGCLSFVGISLLTITPTLLIHLDLYISAPRNRIKILSRFLRSCVTSSFGRSDHESLAGQSSKEKEEVERLKRGNRGARRESEQGAPVTTSAWSTGRIMTGNNKDRP